MMATAATTTPPALTLRVGQFEGPLDLLLHLCRTNEIDLAALPIRTITDQYLAHLEALEFRIWRRPAPIWSWLRRWSI